MYVVPLLSEENSALFPPPLSACSCNLSASSPIKNWLFCVIISTPIRLFCSSAGYTESVRTYLRPHKPLVRSYRLRSIPFRRSRCRYFVHPLTAGLIVHARSSLVKGGSIRYSIDTADFPAPADALNTYFP